MILLNATPVHITFCPPVHVCSAPLFIPILQHTKNVISCCLPTGTLYKQSVEHSNMRHCQVIWLRPAVVGNTVVSERPSSHWRRIAADDGDISGSDRRRNLSEVKSAFWLKSRQINALLSLFPTTIEVQTGSEKAD